MMDTLDVTQYLFHIDVVTSAVLYLRVDPWHDLYRTRDLHKISFCRIKLCKMTEIVQSKVS